MSFLWRKSHNVTILVYHLVCPAKYRRVVFDDAVEDVLGAICQEIALRHEIVFLEIGADDDHVHFVMQCAPTYSPTRVVRIVKSLSAREIFKRCPHVRKKLWGAHFWSGGYFMASVSPQGNEETVRHYVREQGTADSYRELHKQQLALWEEKAS